MTALPTAWQLPFGPAWEALRAGSRPIGAVLYDREGNAVAAGRDRSRETDTPPGRPAGTDLAHAEINALAQGRLLDAGMLDAPTAGEAYALAAPSLISPCR
ncbi:hypothetical protein ACVB8X_04370 [Streptomyces sp. NRAIS4]